MCHPLQQFQNIPINYTKIVLWNHPIIGFADPKFLKNEIFIPHRKRSIDSSNQNDVCICNYTENMHLIMVIIIVQLKWI